MKVKTDIRRKQRVRNTLRKRGNGRIRLSVFRSGKHIYAQLIDDKQGKTLASASSLEKDVSKGATTDGSKTVGKLIAERAIEAKVDVNNIVFDRGGYLYHGRVKALADAAREAGLKF